MTHTTEEGIGPIYGEGTPGARPCLWPDEEAPYDWDDPAVCRRRAVKAIRFKGAKAAVPTCESCLERLTKGGPSREFGVEEVS